MATAVKRKLSASTDGKPIKIVQTGTAGDLLHTAVAGTTAGTYDEIWLWAYNDDTASRTITIEWGGAAVPDQIITVTVPSKAGLIPVIPGLLLQNGLTVRAFGEVANKLTVSGFVNAITD